MLSAEMSMGGNFSALEEHKPSQQGRLQLFCCPSGEVGKKKKDKAAIGGTLAALPHRFVLQRQFGGRSFAPRGTKGPAAE